jgi:hypothetical protein
MRAVSIEPAASKDFGPCPCCGDMSRCVWGYVWSEYHAYAAYFVHWTPGQVPKHGAHIDLIYGPWGDHSTAEDRTAISLEYRITETGPSVVVIDADGRDHADGTLAKYTLNREDVIGDPIAEEVYEICDIVLRMDDRLAELPWGEV